MPAYPLHNSPFFDVREFVDSRTWNILGERAAIMIDERTVRIADLVREKTGSVTYVNTWHMNMTRYYYNASGYRAMWERTGGTLSQHRTGRAVDLKVTGHTPKDIFDLIMDNQMEFEAAGLTTMEDLAFTKSWNHLDCRPKIEGLHPVEGFLIVRPS